MNRQVLTCRTLLQKAGPARAGLYFNRQVLHMQDLILIARSDSNPKARSCTCRTFLEEAGPACAGLSLDSKVSLKP